MDGVSPWKGSWERNHGEGIIAKGSWKRDPGKGILGKGPGKGILEKGSWRRDPGKGILENGSWKMDSGKGQRDPGKGVLENGAWERGPGKGILPEGSWKRDPGEVIMVNGLWQRDCGKGILGKESSKRCPGKGTLEKGSWQRDPGKGVLENRSWESTSQEQSRSFPVILSCGVFTSHHGSGAGAQQRMHKTSGKIQERASQSFDSQIHAAQSHNSPHQRSQPFSPAMPFPAAQRAENSPKEFPILLERKQRVAFPDDSRKCLAALTSC